MLCSLCAVHAHAGAEATVPALNASKGCCFLWEYATQGALELCRRRNGRFEKGGAERVLACHGGRTEQVGRDALWKEACSCAQDIIFKNRIASLHVST